MKYGNQRVFIKGEQRRESAQNPGSKLSNEVYNQLVSLAQSAGMTVEEMCSIAIKMKKGE